MKVDKKIYDFLRDLEKNNNREWFNVNKDRYNEVKSMFERFTAEFITLVAEVDSSIGYMEAKDCIYRIYRDTRFSHDKTPYKNHLCCFVARGGRKSRMPGYYINIEPGGSCFGGGVYCLESHELKKIRQEICTFPENIVAAVENDAFKGRLSLYSEGKLKTFPKGFDTDFYGAEYLKYKHLSSYVNYTDEECMSDSFAEIVRNDLQLAYPLNRFLTEALDAPEEEFSSIL